MKTARDEVSAAHMELEALLAEKTDENGTLSGRVTALEAHTAELEASLGRAEARGERLRELLGVSGLRCLVSHARRPPHPAEMGRWAEMFGWRRLDVGVLGAVHRWHTRWSRAWHQVSRGEG